MEKQEECQNNVFDNPGEPATTFSDLVSNGMRSAKPGGVSIDWHRQAGAGSRWAENGMWSKHTCSSDEEGFAHNCDQ
jgi:hypothetical protein